MKMKFKVSNLKDIFLSKQILKSFPLKIYFPIQLQAILGICKFVNSIFKK